MKRPMKNNAIAELLEYAADDISDLTEDGNSVCLQITAQTVNSGSPSYLFYSPNNGDEVTLLEYVPDEDDGKRVRQIFIIGKAHRDLRQFLNQASSPP